MSGYHNKLFRFARVRIEHFNLKFLDTCHIRLFFKLITWIWKQLLSRTGEKERRGRRLLRRSRFFCKVLSMMNASTVWCDTGGWVISIGSLSASRSPSRQTFIALIVFTAPRIFDSTEIWKYRLQWCKPAVIFFTSTSSFEPSINC